MQAWNDSSGVSRRTLLRRTARVGVGVAGLALVGCGGDEDEAPAVATTTVESSEGGQDAAQAAAAQEPADRVDDEPEGPEAGGDEVGGDEAVGDEVEVTVEVEPDDDVPARGRARGWALLASGEASSGPSARRNPVLASDEASGRLYVHGGRGPEGPLDDVWVFDLGGPGWVAPAVAGDRPAARFSHAAAVLDGRLVITTGQQTGFFSDVWAFDAGPAGGEAGAWEALAPNGAGPTDRYGVGFAHDAAGGRLLLSHGFTNAGRFDDTWSWGGAGWGEDSPAGGRPGERCLHACAYDPLSGGLLLFGGQDNSSAQLGDTWVLVDGGWHEVAGPGPAPRRFPGLVAVAGEAWLFGGTGEGNIYGDLWRFDFETERWEVVALETPPPRRHSPGMAALPSRGEVFVFGGQGEGGDLDDLWRLRV